MTQININGSSAAGRTSGKRHLLKTRTKITVDRDAIKNVLKRLFDDFTVKAIKISFVLDRTQRLESILSALVETYAKDHPEIGRIFKYKRARDLVINSFIKNFSRNDCARQIQKEFFGNPVFNKFLANYSQKEKVVFVRGVGGFLSVKKKVDAADARVKELLEVIVSDISPKAGDYKNEDAFAAESLKLLKSILMIKKFQGFLRKNIAAKTEFDILCKKAIYYFKCYYRWEHNRSSEELRKEIFTSFGDLSRSVNRSEALLRYIRENSASVPNLRDYFKNVHLLCLPDTGALPNKLYNIRKSKNTQAEGKAKFFRGAKKMPRRFFKAGI